MRLSNVTSALTVKWRFLAGEGVGMCRTGLSNITGTYRTVVTRARTRYSDPANGNLQPPGMYNQDTTTLGYDAEEDLQDRFMERRNPRPSTTVVG